MKVQLFGIYDSKTKAFMRPFPAMQKGDAIRAFDDLVNDGKSMCSIHPEDFSLFHLCEFDDADGTYTPIMPKEHVIGAMELKKETPTAGKQMELAEVIELKKRVEDLGKEIEHGKKLLEKAKKEEKGN